MNVGLASGCFDALHDGHKFFLEKARAQCDYLIVAINSDASVKFLKGAGRPLHPIEARILDIQAQCGPWVDALIPFNGALLPLIETIRPSVLIRGYDQGYEGSKLFPIVRIDRHGLWSTTAAERARRQVS